MANGWEQSLNIFSNITTTFYPYQILMDMYYVHTIAMPHAHLCKRIIWQRLRINMLRILWFGKKKQNKKRARCSVAVRSLWSMASLVFKKGEVAWGLAMLWNRYPMGCSYLLNPWIKLLFSHSIRTHLVAQESLILFECGILVNDILALIFVLLRFLKKIGLF